MVTHCIGKECFSSPGVSLFNNGGSPMPCLDMFWWKSLIVNISQAYNLMHMKCKDFIMRECTNIFMLEGIFHYDKKLRGPKWTNTGYKHKKYWWLHSSVSTILNSMMSQSCHYYDQTIDLFFKEYWKYYADKSDNHEVSFHLPWWQVHIQVSKELPELFVSTFSDTEHFIPINALKFNFKNYFS